ncbi:MAG: DegQ family serine endoprotease, partial [Alphaproteobacteria bacterium]
KALRIAAGLAVVTALIGLGAAFAEVRPPQSAAPGEAVVPETREQIKLSFAPLVRTAAPAVANIYTRKVLRRRRVSPLFDDPLFRRFFGEMRPFLGPPEERVQNSLGSGVIVDETGLIVTNYHVVEAATEITVALADRREFDAEVIGSDQRTDLAVLRIDTKGEALPTLAFGDSDELEVGDLVLAVGNPFGVGQTVTSGIVSALARTRIGPGDFRSFIQTDAAINPGNSGGALINMEGKLVGINTAIFTRTGGSLGIGFAIPVNMVKVVLRGAVAGGRVVRPWLGVSGQVVTAEIAETLGLDRPRGVLVNAVHPAGPAAKAGLEVGDVVMALNGREVNDDEILRFRVATLPVDGTATLEVLRGGRVLELEVALVAPPEDPPRDLTELRGRQPLAGATAANLSPAFADEMGLDDTLTGVILVEVRFGSPAHRFNFRAGDIVLRVNEQEIDTVDRLDTVLGLPTEAWRITINRGGRVLTAAIKA